MIKKIFRLKAIENSLLNYVKGLDELKPILSQIGFVKSEEMVLILQKKLNGQSLVDIRKHMEMGRLCIRRKFTK